MKNITQKYIEECVCVCLCMSLLRASQAIHSLIHCHRKLHTVFLMERLVQLSAPFHSQTMCVCVLFIDATQKTMNRLCLCLWQTLG